MSRSGSMWTSAKQTVHESRELRVNGRANNTVKSRRSTTTGTIFPEGLNRAHFDYFVASESRLAQKNKPFQKIG